MAVTRYVAAQVIIIPGGSTDASAGHWMVLRAPEALNSTSSTMTSFTVTGSPVGGTPVAVAEFVSDPASASAWVRV